ncbi:MAG: aspartate/glutamate racemase family protein [Gammaproteobacteria bacterium]|nr:aspartate/glutamate racemase family protein [Gammaproteobacteria bacterium]
MKIKIINPNTTWSMTHKIGEAAQSLQLPNVDILAVSPDFGPASIEGFYDESMACLGLLDEIKKGDAIEECDAYIIACFGDPGLDAARELTRKPVIGVAEAAMRSASYISTGFSVVTTLLRTVVIAEHLLDKYGTRAHCRKVRACELAVLELENPLSNAYQTILKECKMALEEDNAGAIVLGCAGMADLCKRLQLELGVPVIDGVVAATVTAYGLVAAGIQTSKKGDYAYPLPKTYTGHMAAYAPK